jgi:hypothetical protein
VEKLLDATAPQKYKIPKICKRGKIKNQVFLYFILTKIGCAFAGQKINRNA